MDRPIREVFILSARPLASSRCFFFSSGSIYSVVPANLVLPSSFLMLMDRRMLVRFHCLWSLFEMDYIIIFYST